VSDMLSYFQRVVALTPDTYFSVHNLAPGGGMPGWACQSYPRAIQFVRNMGNQYDVYLAMGAQNTCEYNGAAIRKTENTVAARCLYMDIDVKEGAYTSTAEAAKACNKFIYKARLPTPTVIVKSGTGGFHIYWTLSELIEPSEFKKLTRQLSSAAQEAGLLFDRACTTDITRLLRVPETLNFKTDPPSPVELVHAGYEVDINVMRDVLSHFNFVVVPTLKSKKTTVNSYLGFGPKQFHHPTIDKVAEFCPFIKETLEQGGTNLSGEPQWHDMLAIACHCVDPSPTAHRLCEKNEYYDHGDTEKKLLVAQNARQQNSDLGPPKCVTLQGNGAAQCATCPHLTLNTSPVSIPFKQLNGHPLLGSDLPENYFRNKVGHICRGEVMNEGDEPEEVVIFPYQIIPDSGYLEGGGDSYKLTFTIDESESFIQKTFSANAFASDTIFHGAFLTEGIPIKTSVPKARRFFVNYIELLRSHKTTMIKVPPLGWTMQNNVMGFAYNGEFVTPKGKFPCRSPGEGVADYKVTGTDEQVWRDMAKMVLTPDRPDLMVLAASAFSAPLVKMSGQNGYLLGAWSPASGVGKTTALKLAQSVWALPKLGGYSDTVNFTFAKCSNVQDLPVIFDEVKGEQQTANFVELIFELTSGHEKGRADRKGEMRKQRTWNTVIPYATNTSMVEEAAERTQGTHASVYRMFEFQALNLPNANLTTTMAKLTTQLEYNYGHIGKRYANYLGENYEKLRNGVLDYQGKLEQKLQAQNAERYWVAAIATTLCGAALAESLGLAPFNVPVMREFMLQEFYRMRNGQRVSSSDYTNPSSVYDELGYLMNEKSRHIIITDRVWSIPGRPTKDYAKVLNDRVIWDEIGLQISGDPLTLRIRDTFLTKWCKEHKKPKTALITALERSAGASKHMARLASGTGRAQNNEWLWIIPITGTPLEDRCEYAIQHRLLP
jgi:Domain of unknown function (DUF927)